MKPKVLIATAWWPTKTEHFKEYSEGVVQLLNTEGVEVELFITTVFDKSKFRGITNSLVQAEQWAIEFDFTHVLVIDSDLVLLGKNSLKELLEFDKSIVLPGRGSGSGYAKHSDSNNDKDIGWSCCLVKIEVLKQISFSAGISNEFLWPDKMWFKILQLSNIDVWRYYDVIAKSLEDSANIPMSSFKPKTMEEKNAR